MLMEFPTLINWMNPYQIQGLLSSEFQFHSNVKTNCVLIWPMVLSIGPFHFKFKGCWVVSFNL